MTSLIKNLNRTSCALSVAITLLFLLPFTAQAGKKAMQGMDHSMPNAIFTLRTGIAQGKMVYIGKGGVIDGKINPTLIVHEGDVVQITLINGEGAEHDIALPDMHANSQHVKGMGASSTIVFRAMNIGGYDYFCTLPGHREAGMEGILQVEAAAAKAAPAGVSISRDPADLPPPLAERGPTNIHINLETVERIGRLANNSTYEYWTFNGKVPGPFLRVRVGDTVTVHLKNASDSVMMHNVDFHAVSGPGGGGVATEAMPGESKSFTFKALTPGLYVYHCATPMVSNHISNGMYGLILVEPVGGLPKVDREFYVMQGELYTTEPYGQSGLQELSVDKLLSEHPEYIVFNGSTEALTEEHPLRAKTGQSIRIFFGDAGPNLTSSFHVIGTIFDRVFTMGSVTSQPVTGVQTVSVPPGGATIVDLSLPVPGKYILVDHALSRMERGLVGYLNVEGPAAPDVYHVNGDVKPATSGKAAQP